MRTLLLKWNQSKPNQRERAELPQQGTFRWSRERPNTLKHTARLPGGPALWPHLKWEARLTWRHSGPRQQEPQRAGRSGFASGGYSSRLPPAGCSVRKPCPIGHLPPQPPSRTGRDTVAGFASIFVHFMVLEATPEEHKSSCPLAPAPRKDGCRRRQHIFNINSETNESNGIFGSWARQLFLRLTGGQDTSDTPMPCRLGDKKAQGPGRVGSTVQQPSVWPLVPPVGPKRYCCY